MTHSKFENAAIETKDYIFHTGDFENLLLEALDEGFSSLGESAKQSFCFRLEKSFSIRKEEISNRLVAFTQGIEKILGPSANLIEISIMKKHHQKVETNFEWDKLKSFGFVGYITETKRYFQEKNSANIQNVPKVLAEDQQDSVESYGKHVILKNNARLKKLWSRVGKIIFNNDYHCRRCNHIFPKKTATISGLEGEHGLGLHVHCPRCGKVVEAWLK